MKTAVTTLFFIFCLATFALYNAKSYNTSIYTNENILMYERVKVMQDSKESIVLMTENGHKIRIDKHLIKIVKN